MKRLIRQNLTALGLLMVFALPTDGQDQSGEHPSLRSLSALIGAAHYASKPIPIAAALVDDALLVDDVFVTSEGKLAVTLRNGGERTITAWSVDLVVGGDSGATAVTSYATDKYTGLLGQTPVEHSPLRPNDIRRVEYDLPAVSSVSAQQQRPAAPDRFERGDHSVVGVEVGAVVLDDGTVAGRDVRSVLGFVLDRYARAASLSRLIGRVESSERAGSLKQLLEESMESLEQEQQALATAIVAGPEPVTALDSQRQREVMLSQQWLRTVFRSAVRTLSRSEIEDLGLGAGLEPTEALRAISERPALLRLAVADAKSVFRAELELLRENMPAPLRDEIDGLGGPQR